MTQIEHAVVLEEADDVLAGNRACLRRNGPDRRGDGEQIVPAIK